MSYYVIGIGGTGARCMEAFIHLNGAGLLKDIQPVKMVFVDADVSCGNLVRTQRAAALYDKAYKIGFGSSGLIRNELELVKPWTPVPENCTNLDDVFQSKWLNSSSKESDVALRMLYKALYTEQERTTSLDKGFRGHPAIGAAVMSKALSLNEDSEDWQETIQQINSDKDARIFLFASAFGGTGAAGFPTIARIIRNKLKKDQSGNIAAKIAGSLVLPYFQFPPAAGEEEKEMQAKVDDFILNTKAALEYYDKSDLLGNVFRAIYLIGDSDLVNTGNFSLGSNTQKNDANIVELFAALAAFDFFNKSDDFKLGDCPTNMIGRGDDSLETVDKIAWEDLPDPCVDGNLKDKLSAYIKFLYAYRSVILPSLEECGRNEGKKREVAWYMDLVEKAGRIDVYHDRRMLEQFEALGNYANEFFEWLRQINSNSKRQIELVNRDVAAKVGEKQLMLDVYQLVLPVIERKDKMTYKEFWKQLCSYTHKLKKTDSSGAAILMQAVYDICKK